MAKFHGYKISHAERGHWSFKDYAYTNGLLTYGNETREHLVALIEHPVLVFDIAYTTKDIIHQERLTMDALRNMVLANTYKNSRGDLCYKRDIHFRVVPKGSVDYMKMLFRTSFGANKTSRIDIFDL